MKYRIVKVGKIHVRYVVEGKDNYGLWDFLFAKWHVQRQFETLEEAREWLAIQTDYRHRVVVE